MKKQEENLNVRKHPLLVRYTSSSALRNDFTINFVNNIPTFLMLCIDLHNAVNTLHVVSFSKNPKG